MTQWARPRDSVQADIVLPAHFTGDSPQARMLAHADGCTALWEMRVQAIWDEYGTNGDGPVPGRTGREQGHVRQRRTRWARR